MTIYLRDYYPDVSISFRRLASGPLLILFCLAPHGVYRASFIAVGAVGSYPAFSPLPFFAEALKGGLFSVTLSIVEACACNLRRLRAACCPVVSGLSSHLRFCNPTRGHPRPIHQQHTRQGAGRKEQGSGRKTASTSVGGARPLIWPKPTLLCRGHSLSSHPKQRQRFFHRLHHSPSQGKSDEEPGEDEFHAFESV